MSVERRSNWTLAALAAPCLPIAALGLPLVVYLPEFYANELGLSLSAVGAAFMGVRLLDIAFDPLIGGVMDRTRTRFGRFRMWFAISVPLLMIAAYMLFMAKPGVSVGYLWMWLLAIYAGFSIITLSHLSWGSVLSPSYDQRSRIYAWWQAGNVVGMILVLTLPPLLGLLGVQGHAAGVEAMGWFIIVLLPLTALLAIWKVPEPVLTSAPDRSGLREYLGLFRRNSVRRLLAADLAIGTGPAITGALFFFFFERVKAFDKAEAGALLLVYFIGGLAGGPIWAKLSYKVGKHTALAISTVFYAVVTAGAFFIPPGAWMIAAGLMFLIGLPFSAGPFLLRAMMADVGDEERLETGADRTGLLYALLSGTVKIGSAAAVGVTYVGLDMVGFNAQAATGASGLLGLQIMFLVAPAALSLLAGLIIMNYPLTAARHAEIREGLEARDLASASLAEAAPEFAAEPRTAEEIHAATRPAE